MIQSLHALRFIFALMVFLSHLNYVIPPENKFWSFLYRYIFREGYIGVTFFFVLSGYILAYRYSDAVSRKQFSFRVFIDRRIARILPMYYVGLIVALPLSYHEFIEGDRIFYFKKLITNVFLVQSFIPINDYYFAFNGVSWSISTELFFYLCFPLLVRFLLKQKSIKKVFIGITISLLLIATILINKENAYYWLYINPLFRIADFALGIGLFLWSNQIRIIWTEKRALRWEYYAIGIFLLFFLIQPHVHANFKVAVFYWIPICFIIIVFANSKGKISTFLSGNIWNYLGHLSFSFYLLHHSYLKYYQLYFMEDISSIWTGASIAILLLISIVTSYVTYVYIEEPSRKYLRKKLT